MKALVLFFNSRFLGVHVALLCLRRPVQQWSVSTLSRWLWGDEVFVAPWLRADTHFPSWLLSANSIIILGLVFRFFTFLTS